MQNKEFATFACIGIDGRTIYILPYFITHFAARNIRTGYGSETLAGTDVYFQGGGSVWVRRLPKDLAIDLQTMKGGHIV